MKPFLLFLLAFAVMLIASACDNSAALRSPAPTPSVTDQTAGIKALQEITAQGPTITNVTATSATVLLDTKIPVVCAAAYGTTTSYGKLSIDRDMAGGAHSQHKPVLTGLQPDTEYHLRMQGVGPDGTLYQSKDYTFRTAKATAGAAKPAGPNLALLSNGARVTGVSSNYGSADNNGAFGANKAFDGDPGTQWSSNGDGSKAWIEIELARNTRVTNIGFWTRTMGNSAQINSFQVVADDGKTYGPFKLADAGGIYYFPVDFATQKLRFEAVDTSGGNTGAVEIEVYGQ